MNQTSTSSRHLGPTIVGLLAFVVCAAMALSIDVPRAAYGIKSDEATYVAASLSLAYDGDLAFDRGDLHRFAGLYHTGPDGIFLKRGKIRHLRFGGGAPFVHLDKQDDPNVDRLYFGKSLAFPVAAAPFVRFFGLNGFLLCQVVLVGISAVAAYVFLVAQSTPLRAATFTGAFLAVSALPMYAAFLMPEIFNFTLVLVAYVLWLHKEVAPEGALRGRWTDLAAAALLGIATYSKPLPTPILVAPLVMLAWFRRRWLHGFTVGTVAVALAGLCFLFTVWNSGEFNYQGGDRKTFYGRFPFDRADFVWDYSSNQVTTDSSTAQEVLTSSEAPARFAKNFEYFFVGRHFGFVPYFFPGVIAIVGWLGSRARADRWRQLVFAAFALSALVLLIYLPWTWNGGGGSPGNRYFFTAYPLTLFLLPPGLSVAPAVLAWVGGAMFTAKILANPFFAAKYPYLLVEKGPLRRLPVEITMANDLPVRLAQPLRAHVQYRTDPGVLLYHLDQNSWPPEPNGMWISGADYTEVIVRTAWPISRIDGEAESPIATELRISLGGKDVTVPVTPGKVSTFSVPASGTRGFGDFNYLLRASSSGAFIPHLLEPANMDYRNLGVQIRFKPVRSDVP